MVKRVHVSPDDDGIIRVACGSDVIEIVLIPPGDGGGGIEHIPPKETRPAEPFETPPTLPDDPFGDPNTFLHVPMVFAGGASVGIDVNDILAKVKRHRWRGGPSVERNVVLDTTTAMNIHDVYALADKLYEEAPGINVVVDFQTPDADTAESSG